MRGQRILDVECDAVLLGPQRRPRIGLIEPFICGNRTNNVPKSVDEPLGTATTTTGGGFFMAEPVAAEPFVLSQASGGAPRSIDEPVPTITTGGNGSAHALITPYYGSGSGETCRSAEEPLPTVTTKARFGMIVPITHSDGSNRARDLDQPLATITTAHRGELAFIAAAFGEREGQAPRVHSLDDPTPTICAEGRIQLVEPADDGLVYDILFRMLEPHELAAATGFKGYEFAGNKTEVTKQIGNAVCVGQAKALVAALMGEASR